MASKIDGDILFPNLDLLVWKVGSYGSFLNNKKVGDMAAKLKWPIILTDKDIKQAVENGCQYVTDHKTTFGPSAVPVTYTGFLKNDKFNGPGVCTFEEKVFDANWVDGALNGLSSCFWPGVDGKLNEDCQKYEGEYKNNQKHGQGYYQYKDGARYTGNWTDGKRHGMGAKYEVNGDYYIGNWVMGYREGKGAKNEDNGAWYSG